MFKQSRFFFSAAMVAILLVSTLILSENVSAKSRKCPIEPPKTLLTLYLESSAVFIADFKNENVTISEDLSEDKDARYVNIERNLDVIETFKGQKLNKFSYTASEYRPVSNSSETGEEMIDEDIYADGFNYSTELKVGKRYLFFFTKNAETNEVYPTDYRAAGREITPQNSSVLEKSLDELVKITAAKKNQIPNLTEWLVRLIEEEETRWDGASALSRSFNSLSYEQESGEPQEIPAAIDKDFGEYSSALAKNLTEAQKERISSVFLMSLNQSFFGGGEETAEYDYSLAQLVGNWDNTRFTMHGFGMLQSIDKSDVEKTKKVMNFVADMSKDSTLSAIYYKFSEITEEAENETNTEKIAELPETQSENPTVIAESEPQSENAAKNTETVVELSETQANAVSGEAETEELTPAQIREQFFQQFANRYQELLARNFAPELETEIAEVANK